MCASQRVFTRCSSYARRMRASSRVHALHVHESLHVSECVSLRVSECVSLRVSECVSLRVSLCVSECVSLCVCVSECVG